MNTSTVIQRGITTTLTMTVIRSIIDVRIGSVISYSSVGSVAHSCKGDKT